jgi:hypothetical protein
MVRQVSDFWDALAPYHASIENNYFDVPSLQRIIGDVDEPVLVIGAGQGLIVEALMQLESFLTKLELLKGNSVAFHEMMTMHKMTPLQTVAWASQRANLNYIRTVGLLFRSWFLSTAKEKRAAASMQRIFKKMPGADSLINTAPLYQPYRDESEIRSLFARLAIPISSIEATESCYIVRCERLSSTGPEPSTSLKA